MTLYIAHLKGGGRRRVEAETLREAQDLAFAAYGPWLVIGVTEPRNVGRPEWNPAEVPGRRA